MNDPQILILDDDEDLCRETCEALQLRGHPTTYRIHSRGDTSWHAGQSIIVLDLSMPGVDGFDIIERLGRSVLPPRIIIASGHGERVIQAAVRNALIAGLQVLGVLRKPYRIGELVTLIENAPQFEVFDGTSEGPAHALPGEAEIRTAFQTKRRLEDERICGYEALVRLPGWRHFTPNLIFNRDVCIDRQLAYTRRILGDAIGFLQSEAGSDRRTTMSINCPPELLCDPAFLPMIHQLAGSEAISPNRLLFELTETESDRTLDVIAAAASRLTMRGFGVSIDDFGRGNTSLEKLLRLPLVEVKIDRDIFWAAANGEVPRTILEGVTRFCADHELMCTIEGIETPEHLEFARALKASHGQGFFWDRPSIPEERAMQNVSRASGVI